MKNIQTKMTTALLVLAAGVIPAFGQERGHERGGNRGFQQSERQQGRERMGSRPAVQDFRGQRQQPQFQRQEHFQQRQNYQPPQNFQQQRSQPNYRPEARSYRDQNLGVQQYRGGNFYGDRGSRGWQSDGRSWSARGGYHGYVIPQSRFYASFGRDHFFRIGRPEFYGGYPRFQYGGYMFRFVDPFPAYWGPNWYDTDNVWIDYQDGGYYLYDSQYPDPGIPVEIDN